MEQEPALPPPACPVDGCNLSYDVVLRSSDDKRFGAHSTTLGSFSLGFPAAGSTIEGEENPDVSLSETSVVLELLLKFLHPNTPQPDVTQLQISTLEDFSEAAEKYQVYPAMQVCKFAMKATVPEHPVAVLRYALKHGHAKLAETAILHTLAIPMVDMYEELRNVDPRFFGYWALYREKMNLSVRVNWINAYSNYSIDVPNHTGHCGAWVSFASSVTSLITAMSSKPDFLCFDQIVQREKYRLATCSHCNSWSSGSRPAKWTQSVNSHRQRIFEEVFGRDWGHDGQAE
ncbi:hypothetical protein PQX77_015390 [Marasmius sp. AFHP31]|nr:hypothetical protein PQX77_015390 [Marasmius sp. AFHP31]